MRPNALSLFLVFLSTYIQICTSYKILIGTALVSKSHLIPLVSYSNALINKGHSVTFMLPKKMSIVPKTAEQITIPNITDIFGTLGRDTNSTLLETTRMFRDIVILEGCDIVSKDEIIRNHLKKVHYDLIVVSAICQQCLLSTILKYQRSEVPFVMYYPGFPVTDMIAAVTGVKVWDTAYNPSSFINASDKMNFEERIRNFLYRVISNAVGYLYIHGRNEILTENLGIEHKDVNEVEKSASFFFINSNFEFDYPIPVSPEVIMTGCMQCRPPKALPKKLKKIFETSKGHGVIVFSLGSIVSNDIFTPDTLDAFTRAFSRIPQNVIWHSDKEIQNLSSNVWVEKWLPLQDILGHPYTRAIVSHGGLNTLQEAFYHGVPLLGMPVLGEKSDRKRNVKLAERRGIGLQLDINNLTADNIYEKLDVLVNNPRFASNAKKISSYMKDQMSTPTQRAVFYTEYAIRHGGANHFKSYARNLNFIELHSIDVISFIIFIVLLACVVLKLIYRWIKCLFMIALKIKKTKTE